jgi:2-oxoglutarate dehydrogenase E1 component
VIAPKKLLKISSANSDLMDFSSGTNFLRVIGEQDSAFLKTPCRKVVFCSGQVYYDLLNERIRSGAKGVALVRLE